MRLTNFPTGPESVPPALPAPSLPPLHSFDQSGSRAAGDLALRDIVAALRRRYRLVLAVAVFTTAAAAFLALNEAPTFTASAVIQVSETRRVLATGIELPTATDDRLTSPFLSQIALLRSRTLAGTVVDSAGLRLVPDFEGFRPSFLREARVSADAVSDTLRLRFDPDGVTGLFNGDASRARYGVPLELPGVILVISERPETQTSLWQVIPREAAIDDLLGKLYVKPRTQTNVVEIAYSARRPSVAQRVVNRVATLYQSMSAHSAQDQSRRRREFLEARIAQTDSDLMRAQSALTEFRRQVRVYGASNKLQSEQHDLAQLDARIDELAAQRQMYGSLLGALQAGQTDRRQDGLRTLMASPGIRDNLAVAQLHGRLTKLQATYDSLSTGPWRRAETDPDVVRLRSLIAGVDSQLVSTVQGELVWIETTLQTLGGTRARSVRSLDSLSGLEPEEMRLAQQIDALRNTGDKLRDDYQNARMAEAVEVGPVEIIDLADLPYAPDARLRMLKLFLGAVLGLGLGGALAVLFETRDTSIRNTEGLERVLQMPGLATIPRQAVSSPSSSGLAREAYRVLRTNLLFSRTGQLPGSLVITSATSGEGKSTTAANLAITCAESGMRVLLIDCDLRRAKQHHVFGVPRSPGVAQLLLGTAKAEEALRPSPVPGLTLLTAGSEEADVIEVMRSARMLSMIRTLREQFDLLIIDSPPVLAGADASILSALADGVLLVLRAGCTNHREALAAVQQLNAVGAHMLGAVLNDAPVESYPYLSAYDAYHTQAPEPV
ncbi:MAG: polysaccharide biosynthesis tyrosine autokinase [Gemmatimonadetes bacterium]|nr:polysaccharide biosynthesis tyrosine autokinase [Gemmatimonadota bacterium]MBA4158423.1 polysaccharide biosynthesis tyrosine autokinase [Gemmatimonadota bacterium]